MRFCIRLRSTLSETFVQSSFGNAKQVLELALVSVPDWLETVFISIKLLCSCVNCKDVTESRPLSPPNCIMLLIL
jgi:hypothetical protein